MQRAAASLQCPGVGKVRQKCGPVRLDLPVSFVCAIALYLSCESYANGIGYARQEGRQDLPQKNELRPREICFSFHPSTIVPTYGAPIAGCTLRYHRQSKHSTGKPALLPCRARRMGRIISLDVIIPITKVDTPLGQPIWPAHCRIQPVTTHQ